MRQLMERVTCDLCSRSQDTVAVEAATAMARTEATTRTLAHAGWTTTTNGIGMIDICPSCGNRPIGARKREVCR